MNLFFIMVLVLYFMINLYIGYNGWVWIRSKYAFPYKKTYILLIFLLSSSFVLGRILDSTILDVIGGYWLVLVGYSLIILPIANLIYLIGKKKGTFRIGIGVLSIFVFIFSYGSFNAWNPVVRNYGISIDKPYEEKNMKVMLVTDIHIGEEIGKHNLKKMVDISKEERPDIVLISGDILNDDIQPFLDDNIGDLMKNIKAPLGVYAVPGNHDNYGDDLQELADEMEKSSIHFLKDEVRNINDQFYIVGRKDYSAGERKGVRDLVKEIDKSKPVFMLDHQPRELGLAAENGIDLLVSGHTHKGQLFPANFITNALFENDYGYLKKKDLHSFTSSGLGLWGPALRIGSRSEVMIINVDFQ